MPPQQLDKVLKAEWGSDWPRRFGRFEASPIAATSIGQGPSRDAARWARLAAEVQYPGVAHSLISAIALAATVIFWL